MKEYRIQKNRIQRASNHSFKYYQDEITNGGELLKMYQLCWLSHLQFELETSLNMV